MHPTQPSIADKRRRFQQLHEAGCFALPNPWDVGSARYLQSLGFQALATTSSGFAWSQGRPDRPDTLAAALDHLREMVAATDLPINADFENGYAHDAAGVARNVSQAIATGVAGLSIEDATADPAQPLYPVELAAERIRAARRAIDQAGGDVILVGRAEGFLVGRPSIDEVVARLKAYADAGADCLYAPGLKSREDIAAVVKAVHPKPFNLLIGGSGLSLQEARDLGVRRISVGGSLARAAWGGFMRAAKEMAEKGTFTELASGYPGGELNKIFSQ